MIGLRAFDPEMSSFFILFLAVFVLIGLIPFFRKSVRQWEEFLRAQAESEGTGGPAAASGRPAGPAQFPADQELHDLEVLVFSRLAQAGRQGRTARRLSGELLLDRSFVEKALKPLHQKGLVRSVPTLVLGTRHHLSRDGLRFAVERGFLATESSPTRWKPAIAEGANPVREEGVRIREASSGE